MIAIDRVRKRILSAINDRLSGVQGVLSISVVGSFLLSRSEEAFSDIDIVMVVRQISRDIHEHCVSVLSDLRCTDLGLQGYSVRVNPTFGPLKFNEPKTLVFHLMLYDRDGHRRHVIASPFTCFDWERTSALFGPSLSQIYGAAPVQLGDLVNSRRGLASYLDDIERGAITYREYLFCNATCEQTTKTFPIDERHKQEYCYHIVHNMLRNYRKVVCRCNDSVAEDELARELGSKDQSLSEYSGFLGQLCAWKRSGQHAPSRVMERTRSFLLGFSQHIDSLQASSPRIIFLRHAKTALNDGSFLGQGRDPEIAADTPNPPLDEDFDLVVTSSLKRASQTGGLLKGCPSHVVDRRLDEIDYGDADGSSLSQLQQRFPYIPEAWGRGEDPAFPGGESQAMVLCRLKQCLDDLVQAHRSAKTAVVTHNVVLRTLLGEVFTAPVAAWHRLQPRHLEPLEFQVVQGRLIPCLSGEQRTRFRDQLFLWGTT